DVLFENQHQPDRSGANGEVPTHRFARQRAFAPLIRGGDEIVSLPPIDRGDDGPDGDADLVEIGRRLAQDNDLRSIVDINADLIGVYFNANHVARPPNALKRTRRIDPPGGGRQSICGPVPSNACNTKRSRPSGAAPTAIVVKSVDATSSIAA